MEFAEAVYTNPLSATGLGPSGLSRSDCYMKCRLRLGRFAIRIGKAEGYEDTRQY